ncbi:ArsR/SmtB family transcription factor [Nakamurella alba]|uniref:ArsR/SmtB family transcription factor n=1 Tax=Nakamurella alba TaxID=2665158 RepID=UPI002AC31D6F|nr:metalloregulator ArsR/SmtB family transcription factor [Nakamurella alba]
MTTPEPGTAEHAREAAAAVREDADSRLWAQRFALLGDVNRLRILLALHRAPGISVGELAGAVGMTDNATSHALAALRAAGVVDADRDGRFRRWSVVDDEIHQILHTVGAGHSDLHPHH